MNGPCRRRCPATPRRSRRRTPRGPNLARLVPDDVDRRVVVVGQLDCEDHARRVAADPPLLGVVGRRLAGPWSAASIIANSGPGISVQGSGTASSTGAAVVVVAPAATVVVAPAAASAAAVVVVPPPASPPPPVSSSSPPPQRRAGAPSQGGSHHSTSHGRSHGPSVGVPGVRLPFAAADEGSSSGGGLVPSGGSRAPPFERWQTAPPCTRPARSSRPTCELSPPGSASRRARSRWPTDRCSSSRSPGGP